MSQIMDTKAKVKQGQAITVGPKGQTVIPVEYRRLLDINPGDELFASLEGDRVILTTGKALAKRLRGSLKAEDGRNLSQELLEERRSAATRKGY